jgi:hypothetical protein
MPLSKREITDQLAHERRLLATRRASLNTAEEQAALYGLNIPLDLVNVQRQLAEQIAAHEREIARLESLAPDAPDDPPPMDAPGGNKQPFWAGIGLSAGDDMIIAEVGASAQNVAVGKQISQHNAVPADDDRVQIEALLAALDVSLRGLDGAGALLSVVSLQINLLRGEITKGAGEVPSASTIIQVGDWLLQALPASAPALATFFNAPAARRALQRAGIQAKEWARAHFSSI